MAKEEEEKRRWWRINTRWRYRIRNGGAVVEGVIRGVCGGSGKPVSY